LNLAKDTGQIAADLFDLVILTIFMGSQAENVRF
jgi:hypothetical protein